MTDDRARLLLTLLAEYADDYGAELGDDARTLTVRELGGDVIDSLPYGEGAIDNGVRTRFERVFGRDALRGGV